VTLFLACCFIKFFAMHFLGINLLRFLYSFAGFRSVINNSKLCVLDFIEMILNIFCLVNDLSLRPEVF